MSNSISTIPCSTEKMSAALSIIKHALTAAHQMSLVKLQTTEIRAALKSVDYNLCFDTAQKFLKANRKMINSYSALTGVFVIGSILRK